jgi:hypothetical protein
VPNGSFNSIQAIVGAKIGDLSPNFQ